MENPPLKRDWTYSTADNSMIELCFRANRIQNLGPTCCMRQFSVLMKYYSFLHSVNTKYYNDNKQVRTHVTSGCDKDISVHWMTAYRKSEIMAPLILKLGTTWRWVVSFTPRPLDTPPDGNTYRYPLNWRLGEHSSRSGGFGEESGGCWLAEIKQSA